MELEHSFSVPVPVARAWDVLLDVERVAPCMPGATLDAVSGDDISGRIKVKVGPIQMTYAGTAKFTERDEASHVVVLEASGKETRGAGTASASVRSELTPDGDQTRVTVHTTLNVTGKPAQFGRGVMVEVGGKLIGIFASNLAAMLAAEPEQTAGADAAQENSHGNGAAAARAPDEALPIDVLNLSARAWSSLRQDGIQTVGDLTRRTQQQLLAIDGVGPASVADIRTKLADRGLALAEPSESAEPAASAEPLAGEESGAAASEEAGAGPAGDGGATGSVHEIGLNGDRPVGRHAGPSEHAGGSAEGDDLAEVKPLRPARHESPEPAVATPSVATPTPAPAPREPVASWQPPDNDAIDLLDVAGLPVLKRAVPAVAALIAVILVVVGVRRRRGRSSGRR
jgi:carbon monoxide dehydrogenase subunit G